MARSTRILGQLRTRSPLPGAASSERERRRLLRHLDRSEPVRFAQEDLASEVESARPHPTEPLAPRQPTSRVTWLLPASRSLAGALALPLSGITTRVQHGEHDDGISVDGEVHAIRKSPQQRSTNAVFQILVPEWEAQDALIACVELAEELVTEARLLVLIPPECRLYVVLDAWLFNQAILGHRRR